MSVSAEFLQNLKCVICEEFLTYGPVFLKHNGESICGRCPVPEDATRNLPFEKLAEKLLFPCKNHNHGCQERLVFIQQKQHEDICSYRLFACPIMIESGNCTWIGTRIKLYQHCEEIHPQKVLSNPFIHKHNITKNKLETFILTDFSALFIVQTKICLNSQRILYSVRLIENDTCSLHYNYTLVIINKQNKLVRKSTVEPLLYLDFQENSSISVGISSIIDFLGDFDNSEFKITLEHVNNNCCTNCRKYMHEKSATNTNIFELCEPEKRFCKYNYKGCTFRDTDKKTDKHEEFYCVLSKWCSICSAYTDNIKFEHLVKDHVDILKRCNKFWPAILSKKCEWIVLQSQFGPFICSYDTYNSFHFEIYSRLKSNELSLYNIEITLKHLNSNCAIQRKMILSYDDQYDWFVHINNKKFQAIVDKNGRFYVYVTITLK